MPSLGPAEILVVLVIALLVFGPNKMPDIAKQVGKGFREFRRVQQHLKSELRDVVSEFDSPSSSATVEQQAVPMLPPQDAPSSRRHSRRRAPLRRPRRPPSPRPESRRRSRVLSRTHPANPPDLDRAVPQQGEQPRRPDDGLRAPRRTPPEVDDLDRGRRGRGDRRLHLRPRDHQLADPVLQRRRPQGDAEQVHLHRAARRLRHPPEDRHLRRHRARAAGVAVAAVALHHPGPQRATRRSTRSRSSPRRSCCS